MRLCCRGFYSAFYRCAGDEYEGGKESEAGRAVLRAASWLVVITLGALHASAGRHEIQPDGVSYLDVADKYLAGEWHAAINAYWSPLYSWLLGLALAVVR